MTNIEWEFLEKCKDGKELWWVGKKDFIKDLGEKIWLRPIEVLIDRNRNETILEFEARKYPSYFVDNGELEQQFPKKKTKLINNGGNFKLETFSEGFVTFNAKITIKTTDRYQIEKQIYEIKKDFGI